MTEYLFELRMQVRDYECDIQGVVNNAVYQNYLEHTRHEFIKAAELNFAFLHQQGIDPMVYRIEIDYKHPLKSGDEFVSKLRFEREGKLKMIFHQDIYRITDQKLVTRAKVIAVVLKNGRPSSSEAFVEKIETFVRNAKS
jgi:acyl-CoA thioester hydrolase